MNLNALVDSHRLLKTKRKQIHVFGIDLVEFTQIIQDMLVITLLQMAN